MKKSKFDILFENTMNTLNTTGVTPNSTLTNEDDYNFKQDPVYKELVEQYYAMENYKKVSPAEKTKITLYEINSADPYVDPTYKDGNYIFYTKDIESGEDDMVYIPDALENSTDGTLESVLDKLEEEALRDKSGDTYDQYADIRTHERMDSGEY